MLAAGHDVGRKARNRRQVVQSRSDVIVGAEIVEEIQAAPLQPVEMSRDEAQLLDLTRGAADIVPRPSGGQHLFGAGPHVSHSLILQLQVLDFLRGQEARASASRTCFEGLTPPAINAAGSSIAGATTGMMPVNRSS